VKIHHLNCGSFCPLLGFGDVAVTHCLLVETARDGLVLVDTGIGDAVTAAPRERMSWMNRFTLRPRFVPAESASRQVRALGFEPDDVRHIVVTHLDVDHAGGLADFPRARVHVHGAELAEARANRDPRYDPSLFAHEVGWETYSPEGETWLGLTAVRTLRGLAPEIALVPLAGHTKGHSGVAIQTDDGWLLHAGDAYLHPADLAGAAVPWSTRIAAWLTASDARARAANMERLRKLTRDARAPVRCFCSHSPDELALCLSADHGTHPHPR
jgi:glyoxylase-like metal-dependent hydrolase (beta-lactamase superfamily II)